MLWIVSAIGKSPGRARPAAHERRRVGGRLLVRLDWRPWRPATCSPPSRYVPLREFEVETTESATMRTSCERAGSALFHTLRSVVFQVTKPLTDNLLPRGRPVRLAESD